MTMLASLGQDIRRQITALGTGSSSEANSDCKHMAIWKCEDVVLVFLTYIMIVHIWIQEEKDVIKEIKALSVEQSHG